MGKNLLVSFKQHIQCPLLINCSFQVEAKVLITGLQGPVRIASLHSHCLPENTGFTLSAPVTWAFLTVPENTRPAPISGSLQLPRMLLQNVLLPNRSTLRSLPKCHLLRDAFFNLTTSCTSHSLYSCFPTLCFPIECIYFNYLSPSLSVSSLWVGIFVCFIPRT